jgi:hypothetical protein
VPRSSQIGVDFSDQASIGLGYALHDPLLIPSAEHPLPLPYVDPIRPNLTQVDPRSWGFWLKANG